MLKIATHDSATGEHGYGLSKIFTLFAMTQIKSIKEQLNIGVRYFDIRVKKTRRGWVCAHGLWNTKKTVEEILSEINEVGKTDDVFINVTYEGWGTSDYEEVVDNWVKQFSNIKFVCINIKYTEGLKLKWKTLKVLNRVPCGAEDNFFKLDFRSWHTFLPIPILWKRLKTEDVIFNEDKFKFVDFI